ncbi:PEP-utilizing enzyme [Sporichthya polymorpha]|uniref:PEP-utilizing enzyme n=1 Tax=Sporichthya polymorpha TaxID=35751 RepID=UPI0003750480|nr:PEP-utilizing enzyme [Sporichthya polymorpha]
MGDALERYLEQHRAGLDDELCTWPAEPGLFTRANANDQWPRPITPLTQDLIGLPMERGIGVAFSQVLGVAPDHGPWTWNAVFYGWYTFAVEPAAAMADNLPGWSRAGVYGDYFGVAEDPDAPAPAATGGASPLALARIGLNFTKALRGYPKHSARDRVAAHARLRVDLNRDWSTVSDAELLGRLRAHTDEATRARVPHVLASVISAPIFKKANEMAASFAGEEATGLLTAAVTGLGGIHMQEATAALGDVARGTLTREEFLDQFGFRGFNEFELSATPWRDDPATLEKLIGRSAPRTEHSTAVRDEARAQLRAAAGRRWVVFRRLLTMAETHMRWRENGKVPLAMQTHSIRLVVREAARRLVERGRLTTADDVHFLRLAELLDDLDGRPVSDLPDRIARRRRTHELAQDLPLPEMIDAGPGALSVITPERWRGLGVLPPVESTAGRDRLVGAPGSPGRHTGRARIVRDPSAVDLDEGDVIVAAGTDSAWTALFFQASAVVVDVGGPMSHSAIAAREIGIPCVVNVKDGTTGIREGQPITVDGDTGEVLLLETV